MEGEIIACCGFVCSRCTAFHENVRSEEDRVLGSLKWKEYFGLDVPPEKLVCRGCFEPAAEDAMLPEKNCRIKKCVTKSLLTDCGQCAVFPCARMEKRMSSVEKRINRFRKKVSREEYDRFLGPYDSRNTLKPSSKP